MRLLIAAIGRLKQGPERALLATYLKRANELARPLGFGSVAQVELAVSRQGSAEARKGAEAAALLGKIDASAALICLDPAGQALRSEAFAAALARMRDANAAGIALAIGGADGLGAAVLSRAALRLSLGPMVLPHGLCRIVLAEQLYRAMTILSGHPYHRG
jgi:23S rRNA (pseudouridine1915-N3)-methyltransferase